MSEPGRRIVLKTVRKDVSRYVESDLARATTLTLTGSTAEVVDQINARSILAVRWLWDSPNRSVGQAVHARRSTARVFRVAPHRVPVGFRR
jgi:hypothetical protein